jgi:hypothetical protein
VQIILDKNDDNVDEYDDKKSLIFHQISSEEQTQRKIPQKKNKQINL